MTIAPDDLSPGQFVVITAGEVRQVVTPYGVQEVEYRQLNGMVLRVAAVSYPFVAAELLGSVPLQRLPLDVRCWEFSRVKIEYVRALHPDVVITPPTELFAQEEIKP